MRPESEENPVQTPKLLILNDSDPWMQRKVDIRSWAAHGLWFAEEGDVVLVLEEPSDHFVPTCAPSKDWTRRGWLSSPCRQGGSEPRCSTALRWWATIRSS